MTEFFLELDNIEGITQYLTRKQWLQPGELVRRAEKAGEGNMNCTLRVVTSARSFVLKQSRPWVEKYPQIPAPVERTAVEAAFYNETAVDEEIASRMPRLLGFDRAARVLMMEDLGQAQDFTFLYRRASADLDARDLETLTSYLVRLHNGFRDGALAATFRNSAMRALNHEHIFGLLLRPGNLINLDAITPGLKDAANTLINDTAYVAKVTALGELYLDASRGCCLIHGDYFPGSWLKSAGKVYVIDPEFCFFGQPEWDLGVMTAHLYLAGLSRERVETLSNLPLARQFAGVEIMRRLIGVAQLPLSRGLEEKQSLLELSRNLVLQGSGI